MSASQFDTPMGSGVSTFLGAPLIAAESRTIRAHGARAAFLGVAYEGANVYRQGQSGGPRAVREATDQFFSYHYDYDVDLFEAFNLVDCGDVPTVPGDVPASHDSIRRTTLEVLEGGALPLIQGGDHSIPLGTMKALSEFTEGQVGLIQLDCHLDASDSFVGSRINGCCHLRRTSELPNVRPTNMVHIGSRGLWNLREQWQYCQEAGIHVYRMRDVRRLGIERVVGEALEIASEGTDAVALDVDLDVLDCPHAPGVCSPEPGGLDARELLDAVDLLGASGAVSLLEVVELAPIWDPSGVGARMACYIMFNLLGAHADNLRAASRA